MRVLGGPAHRHLSCLVAVFFLSCTVALESGTQYSFRTGALVDNALFMKKEAKKKESGPPPPPPPPPPCATQQWPAGCDKKMPSAITPLDEVLNDIKSVEAGPKNVNNDKFPCKKTGGETWYTIGFGHSCEHATDADKGCAACAKDATSTITKAEAQAYFDTDIKKFEDKINKPVKVPLTVNEYSALLSFAYNRGSLPSSVIDLLNSCQYDKVVDKIKEYNKGKGKDGTLQVMNGLVKRREAEGAMYNRDKDKCYGKTAPEAKKPDATAYSPADETKFAMASLGGGRVDNTAIQNTLGKLSSTMVDGVPSVTFGG